MEKPKLSNNIIVTALIISAFVFSFTGPIVVFAAATAPTWGDASGYSILAGAAITNTGATTASGLVGVSPGSSIDGGITSAGQHSNDASAIAAQVDATNVYSALNQTCDFGPVGPTDLAGATLAPGVHCYSSSVEISVGGVLTLDAQGDPNAVWIFKTGSTLTTISGASVVFLGGVGSPCNVFWQVGSSATFGTTTVFIGTVIASHDITLLNSATVDGRILALGVSADGTVVLDANTISGPTCTVAPTSVDGTCGTAEKSYLYTDTDFSGTMCGLGNGVVTYVSGSGFPAQGGTTTWTCGGSDGGDSSSICTATRATAPSTTATLTLVKIIVGGTRVFADFPLTATGPTVITGDSATPAVTNAVVEAGSYTLSEATQSNYTAGTWSCIKNTDPAIIGPSITLASGDVMICTIQNAYITPSSGGGGGYYPVPPIISVLKVPSPLALPAGPGPVTYTYTLRNMGTVSMSNITMVDDTCSPLLFLSGDVNGDLKLDVNETWTYNCFTTLSATHTNTVTATGWANGISAVDIASATVVVGVPVTPPLIHVTKVPSPLVLPTGGGVVVYTYTVTNPGTAPLSNVSIIDDKCTGLPGRVLGHPGDINKNDLLESNETWTFTCQSNLTETTTNTGTASGQANGLTARDFAIVTVVVAPALPNTGFGSQGKITSWSVVILVGIITFVLVLVAVVLKKRTSLLKR